MEQQGNTLAGNRLALAANCLCFTNCVEIIFVSQFCLLVQPLWELCPCENISSYILQAASRKHNTDSCHAVGTVQ